jgi:hypothetical protein
LHPDRARAFAEREARRVLLREVDAGEIRRDRANRYWWVAIVDTVRDIWQRERGYLIPKEAVHGALVTVFGGGLVDTPLGPARTRSSTKTVREFNEMVEAAREYVWHEYGVPIPSGEEWEREHGTETP